MKLIKALQIAMVQENLNQKELAEKAGVTEVALSNIMTGKRNPQTKTLFKLSTALNMYYADLIKLGE